MIILQGNIHSSKNSRQIFRNRVTGRPFVAKSNASKADEESLAFQLSQLENRQEWKRMRAGLEYPLYVSFRFIRQTHARWDFANLVQGIADMMTKTGYLPDDDVDHFIPVYGGHEYSKDSPGVILEIMRKL